MTLQSPLASLSSFSFVTSGALRALDTRQTDRHRLGEVGLGKSPLLTSTQPWGPGPTGPLPPSQPASVRDTAQAAPILTGIPRAPAGPAGPMGPCAPCEERGGSVSGRGQDRDGPPPYCPWAGHRDGGSHDTHSLSSVSLLASWAGGSRRAGSPRGSRSTHGTGLTTITLPGERSQAQRKIFQNRPGKKVLPET